MALNLPLVLVSEIKTTVASECRDVLQTDRISTSEMENVNRVR